MRAETLEQTRFTVRLPEDLNAAIVAIAKRERRTRHQMILLLLEQAVAADKEGQNDA